MGYPHPDGGPGRGKPEVWQVQESASERGLAGLAEPLKVLFLALPATRQNDENQGLAEAVWGARFS